MAQSEIQEKSTKDPMEEVTEEQFLKNLYLFMKKRDTPIERIPNLGFKQIDLFVMFKTVNELGGYHQVTSHQLWKRVYNMLGGNPRSTSAATCTRRHYEKLLLPYECHLKGILMSNTSLHQPKPYRYNKDDDGGQRPSKRRLLSLQNNQGSHNFQSDPHGGIFSLPLHIHPFYHPTHPILPPYLPMHSPLFTPHAPSVPEPRFPFCPSQPESSDMVNEPLEQLRSLSERYKTSEGLIEPLNLSKKESPQEANINPISSFSMPLSRKNPGFLNKPSTLYSPYHAGVLRSEGSERHDGESNDGVSVFAEPAKEKKTNAATVTVPTPSNSPINCSDLTIDEDVFEVVQQPNSPKTNVPVRSVADREVSLSHVVPKEKKDNMEIEVPLSVFRNWLKLYEFSAQLPQVKEPVVPNPEVSSRQKSWSDLENLPTDLTCQMNLQNQVSAQDLRLGNEPSPKPNTQTINHKHSSSQTHFTNSRLSPSGGALKNAETLDIRPSKQQCLDKPYNLKYTEVWDAFNKDNQVPSKPNDTDNGFLRASQDFASKFYVDDTAWGGQQRLEMEPSAVLMVNPSPASVLHLTTEELMKLKKIISNSA